MFTLCSFGCILFSFITIIIIVIVITIRIDRIMIIPQSYRICYKAFTN